MTLINVSLYTIVFFAYQDHFTNKRKRDEFEWWDEECYNLGKPLLPVGLSGGLKTKVIAMYFFVSKRL